MGNFDPKFTEANTFHHAAHMINEPHEDYPSRVKVTESVIDLFSDRFSREPVYFTELDIRQIHSIVMSDMHESCRGKWRPMNVTVGQDTTPDSVLVPELMHGITPVDSDTNIIDWYREFQIIHPFADGNGRVGGIVVAVHSYQTKGIILAPLQ